MKEVLDYSVKPEHCNLKSVVKRIIIEGCKDRLNSF